MATIPPIKIDKLEFSQESKRMLTKLTRALEAMADAQREKISEINRQIRESMPDMAGLQSVKMAEAEPRDWNPREIKILTPFLEGTLYVYPDEKVITWNDQEYVKTCGELVSDAHEPTYCWLSVWHYCDHEDKNGNTRAKEK